MIKTPKSGVLIPLSGLLAEYHKPAHLQIHAASAETAPSTSKTQEIAKDDDDDDIIVQAILQREKEIEAEIQELAAAYDREWATKQQSPFANGAPVNYDHSVGTFNEQVVITRSRHGSLTVDESGEEPAVAGESRSDAPQQPDQPDQHTFKPVSTSEPPPASTFKLTKFKNTGKPPRVDFATQLKEKKAREHTSFVDSMKANSIVSAKNSNAENRNAEKTTTDAQHLKSVWGSEKKPLSDRSNPLTIINKTLLAQAKKAPVQKGPKLQPASQAAKPVTPSDQHALLTTPGGKALPPHLRIGQEAKARRAVVEQQACEATVKAKDTVPTVDFFSALSENSAPASMPASPQADNGTAAPASIEKDSTLAIPQDAPHPPQQEAVDTIEAVRNLQPDLSNHVASETAKGRRVYTLDALKATKASSVNTHDDEVAERIEAAAELIARHTPAALTRARSPKKKKGTIGRWNDLDGKKQLSIASESKMVDLPSTQTTIGTNATMQARADRYVFPVP